MSLAADIVELCRYAVPTSTIPALRCVLFLDSRVWASDGSVTVSVRLEDTVLGEFEGAVPAQPLAKWLGTLPTDAEIRIKQEAGLSWARFSSGRQRIKLPTISARNCFPTIEPETEGARALVKLTASQSKTMARVCDTSAHDWMLGATVMSVDGTWLLVGSDDIGLAAFEVFEDVEFTEPFRLSLNVLRLLPKFSTIVVQDGRISAESDEGWTMRSALLTPTVSQLEQHIQLAFSKEAVPVTEDFGDALARVTRVGGRSQKNVVSIAPDSKGLRVSSTEESGATVSESVPWDSEEVLQFSVSARTIHDLLPYSDEIVQSGHAIVLKGPKFVGMIAVREL